MKGYYHHLYDVKIFKLHTCIVSDLKKKTIGEKNVNMVVFQTTDLNSSAAQMILLHCTAGEVADKGPIFQ